MGPTKKNLGPQLPLESDTKKDTLKGHKWKEDHFCACHSLDGWAKIVENDWKPLWG